MLISKTFPIDDYVYEYVQLSKPVNRETNNGGGGGGERATTRVFAERFNLSCVFQKGLTSTSYDRRCSSQTRCPLYCSSFSLA